MFQQFPVLIKGAGDLASGVALRLHRSGFRVVMTEIALPLTVRRSVAFGEAVFAGQTVVEGVAARRCTPDEVAGAWAEGAIPVLVDPAADSRTQIGPAILVDAIMAKANTGTRRADASLVVALGPGFVVGEDCHVVVETNRGHNLGRALWTGAAEPDTGEPGALPGAPANVTRVLRAPLAGYVQPRYAIGARIAPGAIIATVAGDQGARPVVAPFAGVLRGLVHPSVPVQSGMKIGDLDPRAQPEYCFTVSDKSLAVAGGVLEAILTFLQQRAAAPAPEQPSSVPATPAARPPRSSQKRRRR
jgi:xanthine dehydrogenase accessory factor